MQKVRNQSMKQDVGQLVEQLAPQLHYSFQAASNNRYTLHVPLPGGGTKMVNLFTDIKEPDGTRFVMLASLLAPADPAEFGNFLKLNTRLAYGTLGLHKYQDKDHIFLLDYLLQDTLDEPELAKSIQNVSQKVDSIMQWRSRSKDDEEQKPRRFLTKEFINKALEGTDINAEALGTGFVLKANLPGGRSQKVIVNDDRADPDGTPLITVSSRGGPAHPKYYRWALEKNAQVSYGAIGIESIAHQDEFVYFDTLIAETTDPPELRNTVMMIAKKGDWLESQLTGGQDIR